MFEKGRVLLNRYLDSLRRSAEEAAEQLTLLAEFATLDASDLTHLEVAAVARVSEQSAKNRLELAKALTTRLPRTLAALKAGDIDEYKARRVKLATDVLSEELAGRVEDELMAKAELWNPRQLNDRLRRAVVKADPAAAAARAQARSDARRVTHHDLDDGGGLLLVQSDVERTKLAYARVRTMAKNVKATGDNRTLDQITADVTMDLLAGKHFENAKVNVWLTLPATTALGVDDKPAHLAGYGWLPARRALALATQTDATWRRILTDPATGQAVDVGRNTYRPPAALRDHIRVMNPTCTGPGCSRPAHICDQDHVIPFPEGETTEQNMHSVCRTHHNAKTHNHWLVEKTSIGVIWTTKHGFRFHHTPLPIADPEPPATPAEQQPEAA